MRKIIRLSDYQNIRFFSFLVFWFFSFLLCLTPAVAFELPRFTGEEVVVTALRMPVLKNKSPWNTSIIDSMTLSNFKTVGEALRIVPGVDETFYGYLGSVNSVRIRGANSTQTLILIDGKRINSPTLGMFDMSDILTDNVEKIEIVRAPLSAIYGSDAVSGVVNIITKSGKDDKIFSVSYGSFGTSQYKLVFSSANYVLTAGQIKADGFRQNSDYLAKNFYGKVKFPLSFAELIADYSLYDAIKGVPNVPLSDAEPYSASTPNDKQRDNNSFASIGFKNDNFLFRIFNNNLNQKMDPYTFGVSTNKGVQTGIEWNQAFNFLGGNLLYGIEGREDHGQATMSGDHTIRNYAIFAQDEVKIGEKHSLTASIRGDSHSTAGTSINPRIGMLFAPSGDFLLRISGGTAFRAPTLNELYWNDGFAFGNTNLQPEKSFSYDIGIERQMGKKYSAKINYFVTNTTDLILWSPNSFGTYETKNVGKAYNEGVEIELTKEIENHGKWFLNYTYQSAIDKEDSNPFLAGKAIQYSPQDKYSFGIIYENNSLIVKHVGERNAYPYDANFNQYILTLPPYTVVDMKIGKKFGVFGMEFLVNNLFNENYAEVAGSDPTSGASRNYPMPGRSYSLNVKCDI